MKELGGSAGFKPTSVSFTARRFAVKLRPTKKGDKSEATCIAELRLATVGVEPTASRHGRVLYPCSRHRHSPEKSGDKIEMTAGVEPATPAVTQALYHLAM